MIYEPTAVITGNKCNQYHRLELFHMINICEMALLTYCLVSHWKISDKLIIIYLKDVNEK